MGYEIIYHYHERDPEGGYNTEETKQLKKKVGKAYDDTELSKAAKAILAQLARRDIWVVDVEVEEYVKRSVAFKESKDGHGIVLKGKKYTIDSTEGIDVEEYDENPQPAIPQYHQPQHPKAQTQVAPLPETVPVSQLVSDSPKSDPQMLATVNKNRVLFRVECTPIGGQIEIVKAKSLTPGKTYGVHRQRQDERGGSFGNLYAITNDKGEVIEISEHSFNIAPQGLVGGPEFNRDVLAPNEKKPQLLFDGDNSFSTPTPKRPVDRSQIPPEYAHIPIEGEEAQVSDDIFNLRPGYTPK